ncbi:periplasmic protein YqjC [Yersinia massiliensis]|nr:periplasmic protein YqjC [Yersinia massiliensis]
MLLRSMLLRHSLLLALPIIMFTSTAHAALDDECAVKAKEIQQQIDYAKQHGNTRRAAGLQTALKEVKNNCTAESLKADRQKKIRQKQHDVTERQEELKEAQQKGDADKISKQQKKLAEAQAELKQAKEQK